MGKKWKLTNWTILQKDSIKAVKANKKEGNQIDFLWTDEWIFSAIYKQNQWLIFLRTLLTQIWSRNGKYKWTRLEMRKEISIHQYIREIKIIKECQAAL